VPLIQLLYLIVDFELNGNLNFFTIDVFSPFETSNWQAGNGYVRLVLTISTVASFTAAPRRTSLNLHFAFASLIVLETHLMHTIVSTPGN
jgi:hypothetical protein